MDILDVRDVKEVVEAEKEECDSWRLDISGSESLSELKAKS